MAFEYVVSNHNYFVVPFRPIFLTTLERLAWHGTLFYFPLAERQWPRLVQKVSVGYHTLILFCSTRTVIFSGSNTPCAIDRVRPPLSFFHVFRNSTHPTLSFSRTRTW